MKELTMSNTLKLICLALLPSLGFASDQTPSVDFSGYSLTVKVLEAYFKAAPTDIKSAFQNCRWTKPDGAQITVFRPKPEDATVNFKVEGSVDTNRFAPGIRNSLITVALVQALNAKIDQNEPWPSWFSRKTSSQLMLPSNTFQEYWLDNGIACKYNLDRGLSCHGSVPRELFDAIAMNSQNNNVTSTSEPKSEPTLASASGRNDEKTLPNPIATSSTEENEFMKKIREQKLKQTTPAQKKICSSFIEELVRSGAYTVNQEDGQTQLNFEFKFSDKMDGFNKDVLENDIQKYGADQIPAYISNTCARDIACLATWFFWWSFFNNNGASAQYFLKNGSELTLGATRAANEFSGHVIIPTELFESMKKKAQ